MTIRVWAGLVLAGMLSAWPLHEGYAQSSAPLCLANGGTQRAGCFPATIRYKAAGGGSNVFATAEAAMGESLRLMRQTNYCSEGGRQCAGVLNADQINWYGLSPLDSICKNRQLGPGLAPKWQRNTYDNLAQKTFRIYAVDQIQVACSGSRPTTALPAYSVMSTDIYAMPSCPRTHQILLEFPAQYSDNFGYFCAPPQQTARPSSQRASCEDGPRDGCAWAGNPVDLGQGRRKVDHQVDLVVAGDFPIVWERTYFAFDASRDRAAVSRWTFARLLRAEITQQVTQSTAWIARGDGGQLVFRASGVPGNRVWSLSLPPYSNVVNWPVITSRLSDWVEGGQLLGVVLQNGRGEKEFYEISGRLAAVENRQGRRHTYQYDAAGLLKRIVQDNGRYLEIGYLPGPSFADEGAVSSRVYDPSSGATPVYDELQVWSIRNFFPRTDLYLAPVVAWVSDGQRQVEYTWAQSLSLTTAGDLNLVQVKSPEGGITAYHHEINNSPDLTGITDADGKRVGTYRYSGSGVVQEEWKGSGFSETDPAAKIDWLRFANGAITDGLGNVTSYSETSSASGRVNGFSRDCPGCAGNIQKVLQYGANGRVTRTTDFNNVHTDYMYDADLRVIMRKEAAGTALERSTSFTWVPGQDLPASMTEPVLANDVAGQRVTAWTYNEALQLTTKAVTAPTGFGGTATRTWEYGYDVDGRLEWSTSPGGQITYHRHNAAGDLIARIADPGTSGERLTRWGGHRADGLPRWSLDADGIATAIEWDRNGRLLATRQGLPTNPPSADPMLGAGAWTPAWASSLRQTLYAYSPAGRLERMDLPDGTYFTFGYDAAGRLSIASFWGRDGLLVSTTSLTYDRMSNVIRTELKDSDGYLVQAEGTTRDALWRVQQGLNAANQVLYNRTYDNESRTLGQTDALTRTQNQTFDALGRITGHTNAASGVASWTLGPSDEVASATDAKGVVTVYRYNGFGDVLAIASPDRGAWGFSYDASGRRTVAVDPRGVVATTTYDGLGRPTAVAYSDEGVTSMLGFEAGDLVQSFVYDTCTHGVGRLCGFSDATGTTAYTYNAWGDIVGKAWSGKTGGFAQGVILATGYAYEAATGRPVVTVMPSGKTLALTYGPTGRLAAVSYGGQPVADHIAWNEAGQVSGWRWAMGNGWMGPESGVLRAYDLDGRPAAIYDADSRTLTWDMGDRLTTVSDPSRLEGNQAYGYDALDRLISAETGHWAGVRTYGYDAAGNRTSMAFSATGQGWGYGYGLTNNRQQSRWTAVNGVAGISYATMYDGMGNLLDDGAGLQTRYDATGRLVWAAKGTSAMRSGYNALGQRVSKTVVGGAGRTWLYTSDERGRPLGAYLLDAAQPGGFQVEEEYVHLEGDGYRLLAVVRPATGTGMTNPHVFPVLTDHLGTPRKILDSQSGQVRWSWDAKEPFGNEGPDETPTPGLEAFRFDLRFPGQRYDSETGLFHNGFRDYHPGLGRYIQSDPLGLQAGWNTYAYVGSAPMAYTDPLGLSQKDVERIRLLFSRRVNAEIANGVRYPGSGRINGMVNNLFFMTTRPYYQVCVDQASNLKAALDVAPFQSTLDDKWTFTHTRNLVHHWVEGRSNNPTDPVLVLDPWLFRMTEKDP